MTQYESLNPGPVVNLKKYLEEVEACENYLKGIISKPVVDVEKPKPVD